jgi:hypothetical protein
MNPAGVNAPALRDISDDLRDEADDRTPATPAQTAEREGLPSSYRMRADSHYVEQLSARRVETPRPRVEPEPAGEADRRDARDRQVQELLAQIAVRMASIESAVSQVGDDRSALARRACVDVISAESWRASWMLRATRLVDGTHVSRVRLRQLGPMLAAVRDRLTPEFRLAGCQLHVVASDWNASVEVDESAFVTATTGAILATLGLLGDPSGAAIRVTVKAASGQLQSVEVAQDDVAVGDVGLRRFFDIGWVERPGGWPAGLGATAARALVTMGGGEVAISGGRRGSTLRLDFERPF